MSFLCLDVLGCHGMKREQGCMKQDVVVLLSSESNLLVEEIAAACLFVWYICSKFILEE